MLSISHLYPLTVVQKIVKILEHLTNLQLIIACHVSYKPEPVRIIHVTNVTEYSSSWQVPPLKQLSARHCVSAVTSVKLRAAHAHSDRM